MEKVPRSVGLQLAKRRAGRKLNQDTIPGVSSALVRTIENGTAPLHGQEVKRAAYMQALGLVDDAITRLANGEQMSDLERPDSGPPDTEPTLADVLDAVRDLADGQVEVATAVREMLEVLTAERRSARAGDRAGS